MHIPSVKDAFNSVDEPVRLKWRVQVWAANNALKLIMVALVGIVGWLLAITGVLLHG